MPYKNWPEICKIGESNHFMMMALATLEMSKDDKLTGRLIAAFPECFTSEEVMTPIPLSLIRRDAETGGDSGGANHPISNDAVPEGVPVHGFDKFGNRVAGFKGDLLPEEIDPDSPQGAIVSWQGKSFVVLENNEGCEELYIAPAECIRVDL